MELLAIVASSLILYAFWLWALLKPKNTSNNLPPGPPKLPFIGNIHQLDTSAPHRVLKNLARKYGPIMHLQLGQVPTVVVSTPRLAREILKTHDSSFADRPTTTTSQIFFYKAQDIGWAPYGKYWRQMKKICTLELLTAKRVRAFSYIRQEELDRTCKSLQTSVGSTINFRQTTTKTVNDIICRATLGDVYKDRKTLIQVLYEVMKTLGSFNVETYYPSLQFLNVITMKKSKWLKTQKRLDAILEDILEEHRTRPSYNQDREDLVHVLLRIKETSDLDMPITNDNVKAVLLNMIIAGTGTSSTTIEWVMYELIRNPDEMKKVQAEVRQVVKGNTITDSDIQSMHYLKLIIKETLRLHSPPLLVPRVNREDCNVDGYKIPAKTKIIINARACATDAESWEDPERFFPERFEKSRINYLGSDFEFIPFGSGRRICPGINFGLSVVEHTVASFLYHFDWKLPNGLKADEIDMSEVTGISALPKYPLHIIPVTA